MPSCERGLRRARDGLIRLPEPEASVPQRRPTYSSGLPRRILTRPRLGAGWLLFSSLP